LAETTLHGNGREHSPVVGIVLVEGNVKGNHHFIPCQVENGSIKLVDDVRHAGEKLVE
jgi:hypothetical protein